MASAIALPFVSMGIEDAKPSVNNKNTTDLYTAGVWCPAGACIDCEPHPTIKQLVDGMEEIIRERNWAQTRI